MEIIIARLRSVPTQRVKVQPQLSPAAYLEIASVALAISHPFGLRRHLVTLRLAFRLRPTLALPVPGFPAGSAELRLYVSRVQ